MRGGGDQFAGVDTIGKDFPGKETTQAAKPFRRESLFFNCNVCTLFHLVLSIFPPTPGSTQRLLDRSLLQLNSPLLDL